jgi:hypothetical protein
MHRIARCQVHDAFANLDISSRNQLDRVLAIDPDAAHAA